MNGGVVSYIALDEPFIGGLSRRCGGPAFEPTVDRLVTYMSTLRAANPGLRIGLIEAYPTFGPSDFSRMLSMMAERGIAPSFLHVDIDLNALRLDHPLGRDLITIAQAAEAQGIPHGIIIWGNNGNADALYAGDARRLANAVHRVYRTWDVMPHHLIFQSWAESSTGQKITPANLPEAAPNTHTALVNEIYNQLRYGAGPRR